MNMHVNMNMNELLKYAELNQIKKECILGDFIYIKFSKN
jgi:hypothetical protein